MVSCAGSTPGLSAASPKQQQQHELTTIPSLVGSLQHKRRSRRRDVRPPPLVLTVAIHSLGVELRKLMDGCTTNRVGKDCVVIGCDLRLGMQALTVSNNFPKIFSYGDAYLGLTGLGTDVTTMSAVPLLPSSPPPYPPPY